MNNRIIINNYSNLSDLEALTRVAQVVMQGKMSENNTQYCYVTGFTDCVVDANVFNKLKNGNVFRITNREDEN